jgi:hypothetical protein
MSPHSAAVPQTAEDPQAQFHITTEYDENNEDVSDKGSSVCSAWVLSSNAERQSSSSSESSLFSSYSVAHIQPPFRRPQKTRKRSSTSPPSTTRITKIQTMTKSSAWVLSSNAERQSSSSSESSLFSSYSVVMWNCACGSLQADISVADKLNQND